MSDIVALSDSPDLSRRIEWAYASRCTFEQKAILVAIAIRGFSDTITYAGLAESTGASMGRTSRLIEELLDRRLIEDLGSPTHGTLRYELRMGKVAA